jgi:hypothetical protein
LESMWVLFRPPVGLLTPEQINTLEWGIGFTSAVSSLCSALVIAYIIVKLVVQYRRKQYSAPAEAPLSAGTRRWSLPLCLLPLSFV